MTWTHLRLPLYYTGFSAIFLQILFNTGSRKCKYRNFFSRQSLSTSKRAFDEYLLHWFSSWFVATCLISNNSFTYQTTCSLLFFHALFRFVFGNQANVLKHSVVIIRLWRMLHFHAIYIYFLTAIRLRQFLVSFQVCVHSPAVHSISSRLNPKFLAPSRSTALQPFPKVRSWSLHDVTIAAMLHVCALSIRPRERVQKWHKVRAAAEKKNLGLLLLNRHSLSNKVFGSPTRTLLSNLCSAWSASFDTLQSHVQVKYHFESLVIFSLINYRRRGLVQVHSTISCR